MRRRGFTLIELMVAMAILLILILMAFASFSFATALSRSNQNRETVLEDMSTVLDQVTKELRQTVTLNDGTGKYSVSCPGFTSGTNTSGNITTIATPTAPLAANQYYAFGANNPDATTSADQPILTFYTAEDNGTKHRISYSLGVPSAGGLARQYWVSQGYEPCQILYSNEYWKDSNSNGVVDTGEAWAGGVHNLPVTGQVMTNFTVTRPSWSGKVIQIVIEAMVKDASGKSGKITRMAQVTLRQ